MRDELAPRVKAWRPSNAVLAGLSFIIVTILTAGVVAAALLDVVSGSTASLIVSAILAVATFGYVLLTFGMASAMKQQNEHAEQSLKLQRKPDIVKIIDKEIQPRLNEIHRHSTTFNASAIDAYDHHQIDDTTAVERFPELETEFSSPQHAAMIFDEVDVSAGDVYMYYQKVSEYCDAHDRAVNDLELLLTEQIDDLEIVSNHAREYAKSAFALEPTGDMPHHEWRDSENDVIPLRLELDEYESELYELKRQIEDQGHELQQKLGRTEAELRQEYHISRADV